MNAPFHIPVMPDEVVQALAIRPVGIYVDGTVGGGGHALLLLSALEESAQLVGIDRDPDALEAARARLTPFQPRVHLFLDVFWHLIPILKRMEIAQIDGCLFDLGVSTHQIDTPQRGFSYRQDGPLDMRMDRSGPTTAADLVNQTPQSDLARILRVYGEERHAARIARAICEARKKRPILRTLALRDVIASAVPGRYLHKTLARAFQAIRIEINSELDHLRQAICDAISVLRPGGRMATIAYHSLEDRVVKQALSEHVHRCVCPPDLPVCVCGRKAVLQLIEDRGPSVGEIRDNPRARSARLRVAEKVVDTHEDI